MARNSLMPQMQLYDAPQGPNVAALTNPLMQGMQTYRQGMQEQFQGDRALAAEGRANRSEARADETMRLQKEKMQIERLGKMAQVVDGIAEPTQRAAAWQRLRQGFPGFDESFSKYSDPNDHVNGPKYLMAEVGIYKSPQERESERLKNDQIRAQTDMTRAHADFYKARAGGMAPQSDAASAPASDPLQGAGLDEDGNIVTQGTSGPAPAYGYGDGSSSFGFPAYQQQGGLPEPMRLGGPRDDIEESMRIDVLPSGGAQYAQARPPIEPPARRNDGPWIDRLPRPSNTPETPPPRPPEPSPIDQARARMYGPSGMTSPQVPGVVTDAGRNRRVDVPATREMQGQRAMDAATSEQQERLRAFRQDQELWSGVYKRQPRAGYYYGPDGRELALTDKNFKGDKESQAAALINMKKIDQASKRLLQDSYLGRTAAGLANIGETGQAFADMEQAALGIAYALSGKTVAVAEMKNFINAYGPKPGDGDARIKAKTERMLQFYNALLSANRGGQDYDKAFSRAMATMGVKNPDGTLIGAPSGPLSSSDGDRATARAPDLSGVSTEDLLRRLGGGR